MSTVSGILFLSFLWCNACTLDVLNDILYIAKYLTYPSKQQWSPRRINLLNAFILGKEYDWPNCTFRVVARRSGWPFANASTLRNMDSEEPSISPPRNETTSETAKYDSLLSLVLFHRYEFSKTGFFRNITSSGATNAYCWHCTCVSTITAAFSVPSIKYFGPYRTRNLGGTPGHALHGSLASTEGVVPPFGV